MVDSTTEETFDPDTAIVLESGSVEYDAAKAACSIDELITVLEQAKDEGMHSVLLSSGNCRGAKYAKLRAEYDYLADL